VHKLLASFFLLPGMRLSLPFSSIATRRQHRHGAYSHIVDKSVRKAADKRWIVWVQVGITVFLPPACLLLLWVSLWKSA
jgi:hypothetical protein